MTFDPVKTYHVVLRIKPRVRIDRRLFVNVIDAHNDVIEKMGSVALAKFGSISLGNDWIERINRQIRSGKSSKLFLVYKKGGDFISKSTNIYEINKSKFTEKILRPEYYDYIREEPILWFLLKERFGSEKLDNLCLASNNRHVFDVVRETRTTIMVTYGAC